MHSFTLSSLHLKVIYVALVFALSSCALPSTQSPTYQSASTRLLSVEQLCSNLGESTGSNCMLAVTITNSSSSILTADISIITEPGVKLTSPSQMELEDDSQTAQVNGLILRPKESRKFQLPFEIDSETAFSGAYLISVEVRQHSTQNLGRALATHQEIVYIQVQNLGISQVVSKQEFLELYEGFVPLRVNYSATGSTTTNHTALVRVVLPNDSQPTTGRLEMYFPIAGGPVTSTITISVTGGIRFAPAKGVEVNETSRKATIVLAGLKSPSSRILIYPFVVGKDDLDGTYALLAEFSNGTRGAMIQLPQVIGVTSSLTPPTKKWLTLPES